MSQFIIPACFYPTTVFLVDDDVALIESLKMQVEINGTCLSFDAPEKALKFLENYKPVSLMKNYLVIDEDDEALGRSMKINIGGIQKKANDSKRFSEITVGIIDYCMLGMNGLELCKIIRQKFPDIKLIMLTAEADNVVAIEAHNKKIIDLFIRKDAKNSIDVLLNQIHELQREYFREQSNVLVESFLNSTEGYPESLNDPIFAEFFFNALKERHITEFYIINPFGDFLLLDKQGKSSWLMIRTKENLRLWHEIAEYAAGTDYKGNAQKQALHDIAEKIKQGEQAPFFKNELISDILPEDWSPHLQPLKKIKGEETYYYAFIN